MWNKWAYNMNLGPDFVVPKLFLYTEATHACRAKPIWSLTQWQVDKLGNGRYICPRHCWKLYPPSPLWLIIKVNITLHIGMPKMMWNNQIMATAVFFSVIIIYLSEKIWTFDASLFFQSNSLLLQSWPERNIIWRTINSS